MWKNCSCSWRKNCNCSSKESKFSENLSKVFPKADEFFDNELKNDDISYDELSEITIPNTQSLFKKTKWWKNTWWVKIFLEREWRCKCTEVSCDKKHWFIVWELWTFFGLFIVRFWTDVSSKNKMKIHLDGQNIYYNDLNMREREYLWFYDSTTR